MGRRTARDASTHNYQPVVICARAAARLTDDGRPIHTVTIAANPRVSENHQPLDLERLDTEAYMQAPSVLFQHDPTLPVAKTLELRKVERNGRTEIDADFVFDKSEAPMSRQVEAWWDDGIINSASINFDTYPRGHAKAGQQFMTEWSFVAVPADRDAVRRLAPMFARSYPAIFSNPSEQKPPTGGRMDPKELVEALEQAFGNAMQTQRSGKDGSGDKIDATALATAMAPAIGSMIQTGITKAVEGVQAKLKEAETATQTARAQADADKKKRDEELATAVAGERARSALLVKAAPFLPQDFDASQATARSILEAAMKPVLGDGVTDKPDGYLEAYLDIEIKNRTGDGSGQLSGGSTQRSALPALGNGIQPGDPFGGQQRNANGMAGLQQLQFARGSRALAYQAGDAAAAVEERVDGVAILRTPELDAARETARSRRMNAWKDPAMGVPEGVQDAGQQGGGVVTLQQAAAMVAAAGGAK